MRKIIVSIFTTLDGVVQGPGGATEDPTGSFKWGGWIVPFADNDLDGEMGKMMAEPYDLLLGHFTYDIFSSYWPYQTGNPMAEAFDKIEKYVVANTPVDLSWQKSTLITGDVSTELRKLKESDGPNLLVFGSAGLFQTLLQHNLVDELYLWIHPLTLGTGKKLFNGGAQPLEWELAASKVDKTGVIMTKYVPKGNVRVAEFPSSPASDKELARRERLKGL